MAGDVQCQCVLPFIRHEETEQCAHCGRPMRTEPRVNTGLMDQPSIPRFEAAMAFIGVDLSSRDDMTAVYFQMGDTTSAARAWRRARMAVVNLSISDPNYLARFNDLAAAESALSDAIKKDFGDD